MGRFQLLSTQVQRERAIIIGVELEGKTSGISKSLDELERLAYTDGAEVVMRMIQRMDKPNPHSFIGSGKVQELAEYVQNMDVDIVIFDEELTPSQQAHLEKILKDPIKVIDRTALVLDIFGKHAKTKEGRLQVQLAQLQYLYPRLRGMWAHLAGNQTRGGIGSRFGMGESQLEIDRRLIRQRIQNLKKELVRLEKRRETQSKKRFSTGIYRIALVGYTNAGKSTLLNALTSSDVYVKDELFATLDPTTRALVLSEGLKITLTDTVGFIQKLPTTLIEAFKSTLSELKNADLLLRVIDANDPNIDQEIEATDAVLQQIGADNKSCIDVFNKCDLIDEDRKRFLVLTHPEAVFISAATKDGLDTLLYTIAKKSTQNSITMTVSLPFEKGKLIHLIHESCQIMHESYEHDGYVATIKAPLRMEKTLRSYNIEKSAKNYLFNEREKEKYKSAKEAK